MTTPARGTIAVLGATGRLGGATARHLLEDGWSVRAITRKPDGPKARALAAAGAQVVKADMEDPAALRKAFEGAQGVFNVQNPMKSGLEAEVRQGRNVADAAADAGARHVVYGSAGVGRSGTGVGQWESKLRVKEHMLTRGLPLTVLRPMALMELMTDKDFYPALSTWNTMPALAGPDTKIVWLAADDLGAIAAKAFADRDGFVRRDVALASDVRSIAECRELYRAAAGRPPRSFPVPVWMFERMAGKDLTAMWRWLRTAELDLDVTPTLAIHPGAMTVERWLLRRFSKDGGARTAEARDARAAARLTTSTPIAQERPSDHPPA